MHAYRRLFIVAAAVVAPVVCAASSKPNVENGKTTFSTMCGVCHSVQKDGGPIMGPNLLGIGGRKAASEPLFTQYTTALKDSKITWNKKTLEKFLVNPMTKVPGTSMPMQIPDDKTRADVVAYLLTLKKK
jgi:cytochrome c